MKPTTRRNFLRHSTAAAMALSWPGLTLGGEPAAPGAGPNEQVQIGVVGLGGLDVPGSVGGRGRQLIARLREIPSVRITALCDVDQDLLDHQLRQFKDRGQTVAAYRDLRRLLEDKNLDAVVIALPNHWHALATVWACQAGKDVYVEKPFSYDLWEGRQMVAAARQYGRMVQVGTQNRSSALLRRSFAALRNGQLGPIRYAHALVYRPREALTKVSAPTPVPASVAYDLWCGPAPKAPLLRKQLHYEWHWFWQTGNGEIGNNGVHIMDLCRWALGQDQAPPRALSIAGRFGPDDGGQTPNTHLALLDYRPAPLLCEVRNLRVGQRPDAIGRFRTQSRGLVIDCEGGYFAGDASGAALYDPQGKKITELPDDGGSKTLETDHLTNFLAAVRSRKAAALAAEAQQGHFSAACCHLANISHRLGQQTPPDAIKERTRDDRQLAEAFDRCREYLSQNGVNLAATPAVLGPWVTLDAQQERFIGEFADQANHLARREYRPPFVVPQLV